MSDELRLNWLSEDLEQLEDVRGFINNEGGSVREAIDALAAMKE